jgi:hypothetical protein
MTEDSQYLSREEEHSQLRFRYYRNELFYLYSFSAFVDLQNFHIFIVEAAVDKTMRNPSGFRQ